MESTTTTTEKTSPISTPVAILLSGVLIAGAVMYGLVYTPQGKVGAEPTGTEESAGVPIPKVTAEDHVRGDVASAELVLVEYSDLECPYCSQFHPTVQKLKNDFGGRVAWVYRHFPLSQIHPDAVPAAVASECVAKLKGNDAFWEFIDGVFANQANIGTQLYHNLAGKQGISKADLDACIEEGSVQAKIEQQFNDAVAAGGRGTPYTVILNNKGETVGVFPGAIGYPQGKAQLDGLLK